MQRHHWFQLVLAAWFPACAASSGTSSPQPPQHDYVGVYDWEVASAGTHGTLKIHAIGSGNPRDTLVTSTGTIIECDNMRGGFVRCGGFRFESTRAGLRGTFEQCQVTTVPERRTIRDATTGRTREEVVRVSRSVCDNVLVNLTKR